VSLSINFQDGVLLSMLSKINSNLIFGKESVLNFEEYGITVILKTDKIVLEKYTKTTPEENNESVNAQPSS